MMDTVLNLGLNDDTRAALARLTGNARFAWDAYRRFIAMFGRIVQDIPAHAFDEPLDSRKKRTGAATDADLTVEALEDLVDEFKAIVRTHTKKPFPTDPRDQLRLAIEAVFGSWFGQRAKDYRKQFRIPDTLGTAVNVQSMAFGNMGADSGTGVAFTRDPNTGEKVLYGEYLVNAQGEDVVAGTRTPKPISELKRDLPKAYAEFERIAKRLEQHYRDAQDLEFTIEKGRLYMLQTRSAKRTAKAALKIATDMVRERLITKDEALGRVDPMQVEQLLLPRFDEKEVEKARKAGRYLAKGLNASPGAATGRAVFDADRAVELKGTKQLVVLVRPETSPDDFHGMIAATGILTARGGSTSHAAVVARGLGLPCVAGCAELSIDLGRREMQVGDKTVKEGDFISIDGTTGEVFAGELPTVEPDFTKEKELIELLSWADQRRTMGVWVNADTPEECVQARKFGAEGVGLARTEHMFRQAERLPIVQDMIMADTLDARKKALAKLLPFQQGDFREMYKAMDGLPVVIRLIDPPLHEFLREFADVDVEIAVAEASGRGDDAETKRKRVIEKRLEQLHEDNPMLGLRGCRLLLVYPEILEMQIRAILGAAADAAEQGVKAKPEIMMPLIATMGELDRLHEQVMSVADAVQKERKRKIPFKFGTMIEIPRACIIADQIATKTEFFSFGTNDLTQTILGISRDDAQKSFLTRYVEQRIIPADPFQVLDRDGVGAMMRLAIGAADGRSRTSRSASAESTPASRRRWRCVTSSGSATCRRRHTACRSRDWPRRRQRWRPMEPRETGSPGRSGRRRATAALLAAVIAGCTAAPPTAVPSPSASGPVPSASPAPTGATPSATAAATPGPGALPFPAYQVASDGVLAAAVRLDAAPGVARTEIFVGELARPPVVWRSLAVIDAFPTGISVANGRVAVGVRRSPLQGGGAFSAELIVIEAASAARSTVWAGSFSAATFRGGGGGPKRATERFVLAAGHIAYTRLTEVAGGDLAGELRVRDLANGRETVIDGSPRWIEPVAFAGSVLAYALAGDPLDEIRSIDLAGGAARTLVRAPIIRSHAFSGRWLLYTTAPNEQVGPYRLVLRDLGNGAERTLDAFAAGPSLNETHAVWQSVPLAGAGGNSAYKAAALGDLRESTLQGAVFFEATAVPGGVLMHDKTSGFSTVALW